MCRSDNDNLKDWPIQLLKVHIQLSEYYWSTSQKNLKEFICKAQCNEPAIKIINTQWNGPSAVGCESGHGSRSAPRSLENTS